MHQSKGYQKQWTFPRAEAPDALWPILSDTDRMNRALGLQKINVVEGFDSLRPWLKKGVSRIGPFSLEWLEPPSEFVQNSRIRLVRQYSSPLTIYFLFDLKISTDGEGSKVEVSISFQPSSLFGAFVCKFFAAKVANKITDYLKNVSLQKLSRKNLTGEEQARETDGQTPGLDLHQLERKLGFLQNEYGLSPLNLSVLRDIIAYADEVDLRPAKPIVFAKRYDMDLGEMLDLFLVATRGGVFEIRWEITCPKCRVSRLESSSLAELGMAFDCQSCKESYQLNLESNSELCFYPDPQVRKVSEGSFCLSAARSFVYEQMVLPAGSKRSLMDETTYQETRLRIQSGQPPQTSIISESILKAGGVLVGEDGVYSSSAEAPMTVCNNSSAPIFVVREKLVWQAQSLSAATLFSLPVFLRALPRDVLPAGYSLVVRDLTIMFVSISKSTDFYEEFGDQVAFEYVKKALALLDASLLSHEGFIVKTMGNSKMVLFSKATNALSAAIDMQKALSSSPDKVLESILLKIGLHTGSALAIESDGCHDYFGRSINVAGQLETICQGGCGIISDDIWEKLSAEEKTRFSPYIESRSSLVLRGSVKEVGYLSLRLRLGEKAVAA